MRSEPAGPAAAGRPHLSVVVPAFNEQDRLEETLSAVAAYLAERRLEAEIVVADDGSTDDTVRVAEDRLRALRGRVLRAAEHRGKGHAVRRGVLAAAGRWVLVTDADLSTPIAEHDRLAAAARDRDLDVAIGSRAAEGARIEVRQHALREAMGKTFNVVMRRMTGLPFRDTQCGFKLLDRDRTRPLFERMVIDGFAWDVELLLLCVRFRLRVAEVPVRWRNDPRSHVGLLTAPPRMLADVARILWRFRRGGYAPSAAPR